MPSCGTGLGLRHCDDARCAVGTDLVSGRSRRNRSTRNQQLAWVFSRETVPQAGAEPQAQRLSKHDGLPGDTLNGELGAPGWRPARTIGLFLAVHTFTILSIPLRMNGLPGDSGSLSGFVFAPCATIAPQSQASLVLAAAFGGVPVTKQDQSAVIAEISTQYEETKVVTVNWL